MYTTDMIYIPCTVSITLLVLTYRGTRLYILLRLLHLAEWEHINVRALQYPTLQPGHQLGHIPLYQGVLLSEEG